MTSPSLQLFGYQLSFMSYSWPKNSTIDNKSNLNNLTINH